MNRSLAIALALAAFMTCSASSAWATDYCVGSPIGCSAGGGTDEPDVQSALDAANAHAGSDTVQIGSGTFDGPFTYVSSDPSNNVTINGANPDFTHLTVSGISSGQTVLTLNQEGSTVANLSVQLPAAESETGLSLGNATNAFGVNVSDQAGSNDSLGVLLHNAEFAGNSPNDKSTVTLHGTGSTVGIEGDGASDVNDVIVDGTGANGILATSFSGTANVKVERVRSTATTPFSVIATSAATSASVRDSVLQIRPGVNGSSGVQLVNPGNKDAGFTGVGDTLEGGGASGAGMSVTNLDSSGVANVSGTLQNSIVGESAQGPGHPVVLNGSGSGTAAHTRGTITYSDAPTSADTATPGNTTLSDSDHNLDVDPKFVDPASDFHLQSGSPVTDAAHAFFVNDGERDLDGHSRAIDGGAGSGGTCPNNGGGEPCPDMGAYEAAVGGGGGGGGANAAPVLTGMESAPLSYTSDAAPAAITSSLTVSDSDSPNLAGATVKISAGYATADDFLGFSDQNGITGSFSNSTGILTLSGSASVPDYQTALRSVTFSTTSSSTATRAVDFQVDDGTDTSNTASRSISVTPPPAAPVVNTTGFTIKDPQDVVMHGDVNPEGLDTHWHFQYGPDLDHMSNDLPSTAGNDLGQQDFTSHDVGWPLSVDAGKKTCFRLVANNTKGTTYGNDNGNPPGKGLCVTTTAYTPPFVDTDLPNATGQHSIDMEATINPKGTPTTYYFQISTAPDVAGATQVPVASRSAGSGNSDVVVPIETASGLEPDTTYYYRAVATNPGGTTYGNVIQAHTAQGRAIQSNPGGFAVHVSYTGLDPNSPQTDATTPTFDADASVQVDWSCGAGPDGDISQVSTCVIHITGPSGNQENIHADPDAIHAHPPFVPGTGFGKLPTACTGSSPCTYHVEVDTADLSGHTFKSTRSYTVNPPPSIGQLLKVDEGSIASTVQQLDGFDFVNGVVYSKIRDAHKNVVATVSSDGKIYPGEVRFDSIGNIVSAGGGNIVSAGGGNIVSAGGGNIVSSGSHNYVVFDKDGKPVAIVSAGGGNIAKGTYKIVAAGSDNIVAAGGGNIISEAGAGIISEAGAGIVSAGGGNIDLQVKGDYVVAAGGGNIVSAGGGNIVSAGGGNVLDYGKNANLTTGLSERLFSNLGSISIKNGSLINSPSLVTKIGAPIGAINANVDSFQNAATLLAHPKLVSAAAHRGARIATAHVKVTGKGKTLLTFTLTRAGHKLITKLATKNRARVRHHKPPITLKLRLTEVFKPPHRKATTLTRTFTITPGVKTRH